MQAPAGGPPGVRAKGRRGDEGSREASPPPPSRGTGAAPRACDARATEGKRQAPPPHMPPPPQGWGMQEGRGGQRPPLPRTKRHDGGAAGRGCGTDCTTAPKRRKRRAGPNGGGTGGANAEWAGRRRGPRGVPHTPAEGQVPCHVPVPCLRRAYAGGRAARAPPPPPAPTSHTHQGKRRGQRGEGEGTRGMTVAGGGPPPEDTAARWGGRGTRVRNDPHDRAQGEHAPCKPQRGGRRGCNRRKGRVTTGATRRPPPPPAEGQVPCLVPAPCFRRACAVGRTARTPPPPPPTPTPTHKKGEDGGETARGHGGGAEKKKKHKTNNKRHQHAAAGADSKGRRDMAGARGHSKGRGTGGRPWGRKLGGRDQRGGGGVTRAREQRW